MGTGNCSTTGWDNDSEQPAGRGWYHSIGNIWNISKQPEGCSVTSTMTDYFHFKLFQVYILWHYSSGILYTWTWFGIMVYTRIYMVYTWYIHHSRYACTCMPVHVFVTVYTKTCMYIHASYPCIYKDMDVHTWYIHHQEPTTSNIWEHPARKLLM